MNDPAVLNPIKIGDFWFPFDDKKCRRHFEAGGLQIDHLEKALEYVTDWSIAVDGGAHVGSWTRRMAARFASVLAFELAPDTFSCLEKNTSDLKNVIAIHAAVGHKRGTVGVSDVGHTLGRGVAHGNDIPMVRIDDQNLNGLGFLKLDLEGYEYFGLKGALRTIRKFRPVIMIEDKGHSVRYNLRVDAARRLLKSLGYEFVFRMKPDSLFMPRRVGHPLAALAHRLAGFLRS